MRNFFALSGLFCIGLLFNSCKKSTVDFESAALNEYYPLQVGKYVTYNMDSTVYINFGAKDTIIKYQVRDMVDAAITDNSGRAAYRVIRSIRKNATQPWVGNNTFLVVPLNNTIEFVENNQRFVKLKLPVNEGYSWKGNSFIDTYSLTSEVKYLDDWDYTYENVGQPLQLGSILLDSTLTVNHRDEFLGQDPSNPSTQYAEKNYSLEKYAKNIGLVSKEFLHWEYQGPQPGRSGYFNGFGVKLTMIDHN